MKLGIVGCGKVVRDCHLPVLSTLVSQRKLRIGWICDVNADVRDSLAGKLGVSAYASVEEVPDVDAILLATPVGARAEIWRVARQRGWHVLCEKPLATQAIEVDAFMDHARSSNAIVLCGLMRREYACVRQLRRLVKKRVFGKIAEVWAAEGTPAGRIGRDSGWYQEDKQLAGGGVLIETGSHLLDATFHILGAHRFTINGFTEKHLEGRPEFEARVECEVDTDVQKGIPVTFFLSQDVSRANGIHLRYPELVLRLPLGPAARIEILNHDLDVVARVENEVGATSSPAEFLAEWNHFLDLVRFGDVGGCLAHMQEVRMSVAMIEQCYASAKHGGA